MADYKEIERKFLVKNTNFLSNSIKSELITQGYLSIDPERTVRVRCKGEKGFITIKGKSSETGLTRFEWEKEISTEEVLKMIPLCLPGVIIKTRHIIIFDEQEFEIDVFEGDNKELVIAELELNKENQHVTLPEWILKEVTNDERYYNSYLTKNPYKNWK